MIDINNNPLFDLFKFPGGEIGLKWKQELPLSKFQHILARLNSAEDVLKLLTVADSLNRRGYIVEATIPYVPGARQDRVANPGEALSCAIYTGLINSCNFSRVNIVDPHSDVVVALLRNCNILPVSHIINEIVIKGEYNTILIPDAGAAKKIFSYYFPTVESRKDLDFVQCLKKRDTITGKLSGFQTCTSIRNHAKCLIVDDIVDGGGTFIGLADHIRNGSYGWAIEKLGLFATHGIFSQGVNCLLSQEIEGAHGKGYKTIFDEIHTTNSWQEKTHDILFVHKVI